MQTLGLIFDLDQTLIDSSSAETLRKERNWHDVYKQIKYFKPFTEIIKGLFQYNQLGSKICIVTSSPDKYCTLVLNHFNIPYDYKICYHDTINKKPHPEPILKALELLQVPKDNTISFGDDRNDIIASRIAGVTTVGCLWGSLNPDKLIDENPHYIINNKNEMDEIINIYRTI